MGIFGNLFGNKKNPPPDFTNVRSGGSSSAPAPGVTRSEGPPPTGSVAAPGAHRPHTYVVVSGDSLSKIAKREYGDANAWPKIFEANRALIKNPNLIHPGQELTIPPA